jgi:hypothetical protein
MTGRGSVAPRPQSIATCSLDFIAAQTAGGSLCRRPQPGASDGTVSCIVTPRLPPPPAHRSAARRCRL